MNVIIDELVRFIDEYLDLSRPVLVGLSGGADSLALFEALNACKKIEFAVAHVDHGWREASKSEGELLEEYVRSKRIQFHLLALNPDSLKGNLEDVCRNLRYAFFKELCEENGYQGVMTGHHAQDQVETVLKRILEGASLKYLGGIQPVREVRGVKVFRPLLSLDKKQLQQSIDGLSFSAFHDPTNADPSYLRARMRTAIIPQLEEKFGKKISSNLLQFAKTMREVSDCLDVNVEGCLSDVVEGVMGSYLSLQKKQPETGLEFTHLLKTFLSQQQVTLSRRQIDSLVKLLSQKTANKIMTSAETTLYIDRGIIFMPRHNPTPSDKLTLKAGEQHWGNWLVSVREGGCSKLYSWKDCWKGHLSVALPEGEYSIGTAPSNVSYKGNSTIGKWWSKHKIPAFFKKYVPVIWQDDEVVHEFLTGASKSDGNLLITLDYLD